MLSEKLLIWNEIKKAAPAIMKAGGNAVDILIWSQGKTLDEVNVLLSGDESFETFKNRQHESSCAKDEETQVKTSKLNDKAYLDDKGANQDQCKPLERKLSKVHAEQMELLEN